LATICVAGLWHQASVVSACLADMGHQVCGVGDDKEAVASLNAAKPLVYEPELDEIIQRNLQAGRLKYTTDYGEALSGVEFAYVAIDTPVGPNDESDLSSIFDAARNIGRFASERFVLIISAQVPVGTCERVAAVVHEENPAVVFDVAYVPEFLRLGIAVDTFRNADRFVVGADDPDVTERIAALYRPLDRPIVVTNLRTAEMGKHASNSFLSTSISFINEIANLCDEVGANALQVARIMKLDRRIGKYAFLSPGLGFAGGTLGRDIRALQKLGRQHGCDTPMMDAVMAVNEARAGLVRQRLQRVYGELGGLQVGVLGLTYKPGTSTLRRSIAIEIIRDLVAQGISIRAFDPLARLDEVAELPPFEFCPDPYAAAQGSDALVLVTEWEDIRSLDLGKLRDTMQRPVFIDTRNVFTPDEMARQGFIYSGVGRGFLQGRIEGDKKAGQRCRPPL
jgi:UDPglucose 6-dehydrogenase